MKSPKLKLISGRSNENLAQSISTHLDIPLSKTTIKDFAVFFDC